MVEAKHQPNASKGIPREPGNPDSGQSANENDKLAFESIIAVHHTYFIVLIAALSVYFGIVGACWKVVFGTDHKAPDLTHILVLFLGILVGAAVFIGMRYARGICAKHQCLLDNLAAKLDICSIDLSLLPYSAKVSMFFIGIVTVVSIIMSLYLLGRVIWYKLVIPS